MKKFVCDLLLPMIFLTVISCRKNYTCHCTTIDPNYGFVNPEVYHVKERKEVDAMQNCARKFDESGKATNGINCTVTKD